MGGLGREGGAKRTPPPRWRAGPQSLNIPSYAMSLGGET
jgi:hypothetical protein